MKGQSLARRLAFAATGIRHVWRQEASFRTQAGAAIGVMLFVVTVRLPLVWCALLALAVAHVLALEMVNSALEYLIDHVHPGHAEAIGQAKDAAAGAVLLASIAACLCGGFALLAVLV